MSSPTAENEARTAALVFDDVSAKDQGKTRAKRGPRHEIAGLSFYVNEGQAVGLLGGPADGTSVLLHTAAGRITPETGNVYIRPRVAVMDAGTSFDLDETLRANVERVAMSLEFNGSKLKAAVTRILAQTAMEDEAESPCVEIDPLDVEKVRLAATLYAGPSLVLVDEPLARGRAFLDEAGRERVERHLRLGGSMVLAGREPRVMRRLCSRIIWMNKGNIIMDAPSDEVARNFGRIEKVRDDKAKVEQIYRRYARHYPGLKIVTQSP
ncbi:ATP-binding cassette domain-containing protein [Arthrobacter sp. JSM 101049]|uniref:ATP-binding cassette domain-containing protein n=1 Tax=Arthrobacter sp. JSM 101049 TaxID=929097 RepID=UPI003563878A